MRGAVFRGWGMLTARLSRRAGAGFHFPGVVVRIVGAVGVAGQPGLGKALSRTSARQSPPRAVASATSSRTLPGSCTARGLRHCANATDIAAPGRTCGPSRPAAPPRPARPPRCHRSRRGHAGTTRYARSPGKRFFPCSSQQDPRQVLSLQGRSALRLFDQGMDERAHESARLDICQAGRYGRRHTRPLLAQSETVKPKLVEFIEDAASGRPRAPQWFYRVAAWNFAAPSPERRSTCLLARLMQVRASNGSWTPEAACLPGVTFWKARQNGQRGPAMACTNSTSV